MGVASFKYERDLAINLNGKNLPVFITETGWSKDLVSDEMQKKYYHDTFNTIWNDPSIIAITPFIFEARGDPFQKFSFLTSTGSATVQYQTFFDLLKTKGVPSLPVKVLAAEISEPKLQIVEKQTGFSFSNMIGKVFASLRGTK